MISAKHIAIAALHAGRCVRFVYDGLVRVVEAHTIGTLANGCAALNGVQVDGDSRTGDLPGWRMFPLERCIELAQTDRRIMGPRTGYRRGARPFARIDAQL